MLLQPQRPHPRPVKFPLIVSEGPIVHLTDAQIYEHIEFLDANVWLALLWSRHVHSEKARAWFESVAEEQFTFCRFTQITVLRLLTTEKIMGEDTRSISDAWLLWDHIWADERVIFLPEPESIEKEFRLRSRLSSASPKVWADAYLLAFASVAGLKLITFDHALKTPAGAQVTVL